MKIFRTLALAIVSFSSITAVAQSAPGYDVVLLVGQSNMVGYNTGTDNAADAATSPRVFMWNNSNNTIVPAQDPIPMNDSYAGVGPGLTFGKAYAASLASNRNVLLVGAAKGGTGFADGWLAPSGSLATTAVTWANQAMAAAGAGARFAGIVWDQGESDVTENSSSYPSAANYQTNLTTLIKYFRSNITGASSTTPFIATEMNYYWLVSNYNAPSSSTTYNAAWYAPSIVVQRATHTLPDVVNNTAWTDTAVLYYDSYWGEIHYNRPSQRQIGRRDADRFFEAQLGVPQTQSQLVYSDSYFVDEGRSYLDQLPFNYFPANNGTVTAVADTARGTIAQIAHGRGFIAVNVPANTFNGSYTKMAWFKPGALGYYNNLVSGNTNGQAHYMLALTGNAGQLSLYGGHSDGTTVPLTVSANVAAPANQWENIALVYDATAKTMTLYYNGAAVSSANNVPAAPQVAAGGTLQLDFGSYGQNSDGSANAGIDGSMGGNRVWTSALTGTQINAIYQHELLYRAGW